MDKPKAYKHIKLYTDDEKKHCTLWLLQYVHFTYKKIFIIVLMILHFNEISSEYYPCDFHIFVNVFRGLFYVDELL